MESLPEQETGPRASNLTAMRRRHLSLALACGLVVAGCGRSSERDARPENRSVGAGVLQTTTPDETTTTTGALAPTASTTPAPPSTGTIPTIPPQAPGPANVASGVIDGLRIEVVAEDGPVFPSRPRFRIQVTLENVSDEGRFHVVGQADYAAILDSAGTMVWRSNECNPTMGIHELDAGAQEVMPGEQITVVVRYPQPDLDEDQGCDLPDGTYRLVGIFPMCPREHVRETPNPGTYVCEEGQVRQYASDALEITIG